ncbi:hypothetical protein ACTA71_004273 [Dictyostelium dimigraforme]
MIIISTRVKRSADLVNAGKWWCLNHSKSGRGESNDRFSGRRENLFDQFYQLGKSAEDQLQLQLQLQQLFTILDEVLFIFILLEVVVTHPRVDNTGFNIKLVVVDHNYK